MRPRFLGILLAILVVLGGLNLVQAIRGRVQSNDDLETKVERAIEIEVDSQVASDVYLDKSFKVEQGQTLVVDVQHADIVVETGQTNEARLVVTIDARSDSRARELFELMNFQAFQEGGRVVLRSSPRDNWDWNGRFEIDVLAVIPERFDLELRSTHGDVELESIAGNVSLETTHGDLDADGIQGDRIRLVSTHGDVYADALLASGIEIRTTHGDISIDRIDSDRFDAVTTHSDIEIDEFSGAGEVTTTHGDVEVSIVRLGGLRVQTSHGDVYLAVPDGQGATVNLRGEHVSLPSVSSFDGSLQDEQAKGLLNGGGPSIDVTTSFGEVRLGTD